MKRMKRKLTHNWGLKLTSVLIAIVIWMLVSNNNDPEVTRAIRNIPISFKNQEVITEVNKSYTVVDGVDRVSLYVTGRKSITNQLNTNAFTIRADLLNYNEALGTVPLEVSCSESRIRQEDIRIIPSVIKLSMEDKVEESFGIVAALSGKSEKGYEIGSASIVSGDTVKIAGPESLINIIGKVTIVVDISDIREDIEENFPIHIEDKNGASFTESQMSKLEIKNEEGVILADNKARVAVMIWKLYPEIPVQVDLVGQPASNYRVSKLAITPKTVNLVGAADSIEQLNGVLKLRESISVEGLDQTQEYTLDLNDTLNQYDNIRLEANTTSTIKVTVNISESGSRNMLIPISALQMKNIPKDKKLIFSPADYVSVNVKTKTMDLDEISIDDIKAAIDLKNCQINDSYIIPVEIEVPDGYEVVGEVNLVVNIEDADQEAEREIYSDEE